MKAKVIITITAYYESASYQDLASDIEGRVQTHMQSLVGVVVPSKTTDKIVDVKVDVESEELS